MYSERPSLLPGAFVWTKLSDGTPGHVLPDGCMDLLWDGQRVQIAGPDTAAFLFAAPAGGTMTGLRFAPGDAPLVLAVPAHEFVNERVALDTVWSTARVRELTAQLESADDPGSILEAIAGPALVERSAWTDAVVAQSRVGVPVDVIADVTGLSSRQLRRRCLDAFGYGPKLLHRIFRMRQALDRADAGQRLADVAASCGYADQAHLTRDVKELAGAPIGQLVAANRSTALPSGSNTTA